VHPGTVLDGYKASDFLVPTTEEQARAHVLGPMFAAAIDKEMKQMVDKGVTKEVAKLPPGARPVKTKLVFDIKGGPKGEVVKVKARWVACGCSQIPGRDYGETYAPTGAKMSMRMMIGVALMWDMYLFEFDVEGAFLLPVLDRELYATYKGNLPPGQVAVRPEAKCPHLEFGSRHGDAAAGAAA
jgi:hypothetical protein